MQIFKQNNVLFSIIIINNFFNNSIGLIEKSSWGSEFAESWFLVMTGHVVPLDAVGVEVVEDGQAHLIAVAVVRLRLNGFSSTERKWLNFITVIRNFCVNQQQTFQTIKFFQVCLK